MLLFLQVPEQNLYKRNNLSVKTYSETMTYGDLIFGIVVLFEVIMKEKIVFSGLIRVFTSKNFSLVPLY